jgi:hypothetical protein
MNTPAFLDASTASLDALASMMDTPLDVVARDMASALKQLLKSKTVRQHVGRAGMAHVRRVVAQFRRRVLDGDPDVSIALIADEAGLPHEYVSTYFLYQLTTTKKVVFPKAY